MKQINIKFNGKDIQVNEGITILQAAKEQGIFIPTLCEDERLEHFASCRVCLVEVKGAKAFMPACSTYVQEGMEIVENSKDILESRKMSLELMVSNHFADCYAPCNRACPAGIDIQGYIAHIANGDHDLSLQLIKEKVALPVSLGRVCPQFCKKDCYRQFVEDAIHINPLKRFVAELDINSENPYIPEMEELTGKKVAIIGSGPAGLSASYYLRIKGYKPVIFERMPAAGGMLRYGIPEYRLPKDLLDKEIGLIEKMGVEIKLGTDFGKDITYNDVKDEYQAIFISIGAQFDTMMGIDGEDAEGYHKSIEFLRSVSSGDIPKIGKKCAVVGGGNTAMDVCRTLVRLGVPEVHIIYRRNREAMPANEVEVEEAMEEGVIFDFLTHPLKILKDDENKLIGLNIIEMELGEPDSSGRRRPVEKKGTEHDIAFDTVITAIGQKVDRSDIDGMGLEFTKWGTVDAKDGIFSTNVPGIFAGGDCVLGASTVVESIANGRKASDAIDHYLKYNKDLEIPYEFHVEKKDFRKVTSEDFKDMERSEKQKIEILSPEMRKDNFKQFEFTLKEENAISEAERCMQCGCLDLYECKLKDYCSYYNINKKRYEGDFAELLSDNTHPYINISMNKCILCGKCVRACSEMVGVNALGFVERGFITNVGPRVNSTFADSPECVSCGLCAEMCPTGAIISIPDAVQPGPHKVRYISSVCPNCDLGCEIDIAFNGEELKYINGKEDSPISHGMLCALGKYGYNEFKQHKGTKEFSEIAGMLDQQKDKKVGFALGMGFTNEEYLKIIRMAKKYNAEMVCYDKSGIGGFSNSHLEDILNAERVLLFGDDLIKYHGVLRYHITKARSKGAKLIYIGDNYDRHINADKVLHQLPEIQDNDIIILRECDIAKIGTSSLKNRRYIILKQFTNENGRDMALYTNGIYDWDNGKQYDIIFNFDNSDTISGENIINITDLPLHSKKGSILSCDLRAIELHGDSTFAIDDCIELKPRSDTQLKEVTCNIKNKRDVEELSKKGII